MSSAVLGSTAVPKWFGTRWKRKLKIIDHYSYDIIQLLPVKGCIVLFLLVSYVMFGSRPWNNVIDSMYRPRTPIPKFSEINTDDMENNITFVTAYFYLETFTKGDSRQGLHHYLAWLEGFSELENDLIAFTDSREVEDKLRRSRIHLPRHKTKIYFINQGDMWAFNLAPQIREIFAQPGYPTHHPNTVIERYACVMHAKYELMETVIRERMFQTKYLAWIDIGYFRVNYGKHFELHIPPDFKDDHVAFVEMNAFQPHTASTVIRDNLVWIAGGMFIGRPEYLMVFIEDYKRLVELMITRRLMSTDQQMLYIMYTKAEHARPRVPVQTYISPCRCDWFYLGKHCRVVYERSRKTRQRRRAGRGKLLSILQLYM